jgi:hypothetical protein
MVAERVVASRDRWLFTGQAAGALWAPGGLVAQVGRCGQRTAVSVHGKGFAQHAVDEEVFQAGPGGQTGAWPPGPGRIRG